MPGLLICCDGGDGAGKTGQVRALASGLREMGYKVTLTKEPCDSGSAGQIRDLLLTGDPDKFCGTSELLLFAAARVEHLRSVVLPALARSEIVLTDRWVSSTIAYQAGGRGVDERFIRSLHDQTTNALYPNCTLLFDIDPRVGLARSTKRLKAEQSSEGRFAALDLAFHERVRSKFLEQARDDATWIVIDASRSMDAVQMQAMACVLNVVNRTAGLA